MKKEFADYLAQIGAPMQVRDRIEMLCKSVEVLFGEEYDEIFVEAKKKDDTIVYTSLWLFSGSIATECKNFMSSDDFDWIDLTQSVTYINITKQNWLEWDKPKDESTMFFSAGIGQNVYTCAFSAIGVNCSHLLDIARHYFFTNRGHL